MSNPISPDHYKQGKIEAIDVIEDWKLGYHLGCALKYIARADHKGSRTDDLGKAIWYLQREIGMAIGKAPYEAPRDRIDALQELSDAMGGKIV